MKIINNELIRSFSPCYDPREKGIADDETLPVLEWVEKYHGVVPAEDILWLLLRNDFLSDKDLRLFAVWCARESLKLVDKPDIRSIEACNVAERYANGEATKEELYSASEAASAAEVAIREAAWVVAWTVAWAAARAAVAATWGVARYAANETAREEVMAAAWGTTREEAGNIRNLQLNYLLTFFNKNKIK